MMLVPVPKFDLHDKSFVHVRSYGGEVMMITAVHVDMGVRYDLQARNGTTYANIGEYELTAATEEEILAALGRDK